ncbi:hypothetical protein CFO_g346 [Ceratocystis platani]|uniref:Uncharacterized protein n=2 Tax=Ceratocystis TaxID=5157 RepID=A0A0F8B5A5_CERFI|nr:hypothetical protein CFO_g346 [Ceratocystis platani]
MAPNSFVFLSLAPVSSDTNAAAAVAANTPMAAHPFLSLSPTTSVTSPVLAARTGKSTFSASPASSRHNSIDFLSLAPISNIQQPGVAAMSVVAAFPKNRRSSSTSTKSDTSLRFLKLSPVHNGKGDEEDFALADA